MDGNDFARLFRAEGIGQILATVEENDDERPCLKFRIPDTEWGVLTCSVSASTDDYDAAEQFAYAMLKNLTEEAAVTSVKPLIEFRDRIAQGEE